MRIPQKADYALRAILEIAAGPEGSRVAAGEVADRLGLPRRFVEQLVGALATAGVVTCRRGRGGGCTLARSPEAISVSEVLAAIGVTTLEAPDPAGAVGELWDGISRQVDGALRSTTIADLVREQRRHDAAGDYAI